MPNLGTFSFFDDPDPLGDQVRALDLADLPAVQAARALLCPPLRDDFNAGVVKHRVPPKEFARSWTPMETRAAPKPSSFLGKPIC